MDQIKIGKFIAERRKAQNLTQMQLAEKLGITELPQFVRTVQIGAVQIGAAFYYLRITGLRRSRTR